MDERTQQTGTMICPACRGQATFECSVCGTAGWIAVLTEDTTIVRGDGQPLQLAQSADTLERALLHAMTMERKAATRVKRASTLLLKWQRNRRRIERRIGDSEVRRIINRLTQNVPSTDSEKV